MSVWIAGLEAGPFKDLISGNDMNWNNFYAADIYIIK
jgi:hypothetical protein